MNPRKLVRCSALATIALAALAVGEPAAEAGTLHYVPHGYVASYAPDEVNGADVTVTHEQLTITFADATPGASIDAPDGCQQVAAAVPTVSCDASGVGIVELDGGPENDTLRSDGSYPVTLSGGGGADHLISGAGSDTLKGGAGADDLEGGPGYDALYAGDCGDTLDGGPGGDGLYLAGGNTQAYGGEGDDSFIPRLADCSQGNELHGGPGTDRVAVVAEPGIDAANAWPADRPLFVSFDDVANDGWIGGGAWNVHSDIENVDGGPEEDILTGSGAANAFDGGPGDDILDGAAGADSLNGGAGEDAVDYSDRSAPVTVDLRSTGATAGEANEHDSLNGIEDVWGGSGADTLIGDANDNILDGDLGADHLTGGAGNDLVDYSWRTAAVTADLTGSSGNDGAAGEGDTIAADVEGLAGGSGNDVLVGNASDGELYGGPGADYLADTGGRDDIDGGPGTDVVSARDKANDTIDCGTESDQANTDAADAVLGCETVTGIDPTPPPSPDTVILARPSGVYAGGGPQVFRFASNVPGATFRCTVDGTTSVCSSPFTLSNLSQGMHDITISAVTPGGIFDPTPETWQLNVDRTAPTATVNVPHPGCINAKGTSIRIRGVDAAGVGHITVVLGRKTIVDAAKAVVRVRLTAKQVRDVKVKVIATDTAGNVATTSMRLRPCATRHR